MKQPLLYKSNSEYTHASGVVRGLEKYLLTRADYQKVFDAEPNQIGAVLSELGYGGSEHNPEHALDTAIEQLFIAIDKLSKDRDFTNVWRIRYDLQNVQSYLKAHFLGEEIDTFAPWGSIQTDVLTRKIEAELNNEKSELPEPIANAVKSAKKLFNSYHSAVAVDVAVDIEFAKYIKSILPESEYFERWFAVYADWANVKSFVRTVRSNLPIGLLWDGFVPGGDIPKDRFLEALENDKENIHTTFTYTEYGMPLANVVKNAFSGQLVQMDIFFQKSLRSLHDSTKFCLFGPELVWAYMGMKHEEIKSLRIILRARGAKLPFEMIKEVTSVVMD